MKTMKIKTVRTKIIGTCIAPECNYCKLDLSKVFRIVILQVMLYAE